MQQRLRLRPGAAIDEDGPWLTQALARVSLADTSEAGLGALRAMAAPDGLDAATLAVDPPLALFVNRLEAGGWVARTVLASGIALVTREPLAYVDAFTRQGVPGDVALRLSRFAMLRREGEELVVESGAAHARATVHDPRVAALLATLAAPRRPEQLDGLAADERDAVLRLLLQARLLVREGDEEGQAVEQWSPVDLLFHARSRLGRRPPGYGGTYPFRERFADPPALRPPGDGERVALAAPDLAAAAAADPPLTHAIEHRHSTRVHDDDAPITAAQLGELLYRAQRVRHVLEAEDHGTFALRPYPNGGALYELEVYPAVRLCDGVDRGLWFYDGHAHALERRDCPDAHLTGLLELARISALMDEQPQVVLIVAARFPRTSWKYEGMPYALTLKHVGVLYQTVYLVATAMRLAVCGLGGGDADLFARAAGTDYLEETSVGEMIVGSIPPGVTGPGIAEVAEPTRSF